MYCLDFPVIRQSTLDTCSCVSLQACLCYYGIDQREGQLAKLMKIVPGVNEIRPETICKVARKFKLRATYKKMTIEDIKKYVGQKKPVICNFQGWLRTKGKKAWLRDNDGHYAVVIGYCDIKKWLIFADPSCFNRTYLPYKEFQLRWHDGDKTDWDYSNMGIVIDGKKPKYNSARLVKIS